MDFELFEKQFSDISGPCMDCKKINPLATGCCQGCKTWDQIMVLVMRNHIERQAEKIAHGR